MKWQLIKNDTYYVLSENKRGLVIHMDDYGIVRCRPVSIALCDYEEFEIVGRHFRATSSFMSRLEKLTNVIGFNDSKVVELTPKFKLEPGQKIDVVVHGESNFFESAEEAANFVANEIFPIDDIDVLDKDGDVIDSLKYEYSVKLSKSE